ncbi:PH domain-containing protein [Microtetraspora malaysiensis]|uniref:PH domain-containing protein n=1 Tax=Microtetraspora malaysiensis TaxID=161358 RepID=A0ABW6SXA4_9ACTN
MNGDGGEEWRRLHPRMLAVHPFHVAVRAVPALLGLSVAGSRGGIPGHILSFGALGLMVVIGVLQWFTTTFRITDEHVQVRKGLFRRQVVTVPRDRVRSVDVTSHILHRVLGLARVEIGTGRSDQKGGGAVKLDALGMAEAAHLREELLHRRPAAAARAGEALTGAPGPYAATSAGVVTGPADGDPAASSGSGQAPWAETDALTSTGHAATGTGPQGAGWGSPADPRGDAAPVTAAAHRNDAWPTGAAPAWDAGQEETELARLRPRWIRYAPFTLSGIVAIGVVAGFLSRLINEGGVDLRQVGALRDGWAWFTDIPVWTAITASVVALIVFVAVASTLGYVLSFWGFRLTRHSGGTLHVTRGLVTARATTIEERRLRGVEVSEPLLLRAVRGARLIAVTTGLRVGRGAQRGGSMLLPPAPVAEVERLAEVILAPDPSAAASPREASPGESSSGQASSGEASPITVSLVPHGPAALRRRFTRALGVNALAVLALLALWEWVGVPAWTWITALACLPLAALLAADRYRSLGHAMTPEYLVTRWGSLVRRRVALERDGIIGWNVTRSFFQRRAGLATLTATTAAGRQGYGVSDVAMSEAIDLAAAGLPGLLDPFLVVPEKNTP